MLQNAILRIKIYAIKIREHFVILPEPKHGAILISQMINYAQHRMVLIALVSPLVGT